jgi:hypothetical protein
VPFVRETHFEADAPPRARLRTPELPRVRRCVGPRLPARIGKSRDHERSSRPTLTRTTGSESCRRRQGGDRPAPEAGHPLRANARSLAPEDGATMPERDPGGFPIRSAGTSHDGAFFVVGKARRTCRGLRATRTLTSHARIHPSTRFRRPSDYWHTWSGLIRAPLPLRPLHSREAQRVLALRRADRTSRHNDTRAHRSAHTYRHVCARGARCTERRFCVSLVVVGARSGALFGARPSSGRCRNTRRTGSSQSDLDVVVGTTGGCPPQIGRHPERSRCQRGPSRFANRRNREGHAYASFRRATGAAAGSPLAIASTDSGQLRVLGGGSLTDCLPAGRAVPVR